MDLYRLSGRPEDFMPLNLEHVFRNCVSVVEWPVRLPPSLQPPTERRLHVDIRIRSNDDEGDGDGPRLLTLSYPEGSHWQQHIDRIRLEGYLDDMLL
jgi:tRNA A37 threonylcarbamoyladenosine biosynthesis protein TsaE